MNNEPLPPTPEHRQRAHHRIFWQFQLPKDIDYKLAQTLTENAGFLMFHWNQPEEFVLGSKIVQSPEDMMSMEPTFYIQVTRKINEKWDIVDGTIVQLVTIEETDEFADFDASKWDDIKQQVAAIVAEFGGEEVVPPTSR